MFKFMEVFVELEDTSVRGRGIGIFYGCLDGDRGFEANNDKENIFIEREERRTVTI